VLNNVHQLSARVQSALMGFLDSGHYRPVNSPTSVSAVVAIVGITDRKQLMASKNTCTVRADFIVRLAQVTLAVPSLSRCVGDIEKIARFILFDCIEATTPVVRFSETAISALNRCQWEGNIEQLRRTILKSLAQHKSGPELELVQDDRCRSEEKDEIISPYLGRSVWELERELLLGTLEFHSGDRKRAADTLGVSLKTLYNRMNAYEDSI